MHVTFHSSATHLVTCLWARPGACIGWVGGGIAYIHVPLPASGPGIGRVGGQAGLGGLVAAAPEVRVQLNLYHICTDTDKA